jgi:uncharacterized membrane protein
MTEQTEDSVTDDTTPDGTTTDDTVTDGTATDDAASDARSTEGGTTETDQPREAGSEGGAPDLGEIGADAEFISAERLIFFTDAVVAIAMTLLAFGLTTRLPGGENIGAALKALGQPWREYLAFLISFVVIGRHWRTHHRLFRYVSRLDARIVTLNLVWLLMIVITPFATRLLASSGSFAIGFSLYAVIQVITILTALLMSRHIRVGDLLRPGAPESGPADDDLTALIFAAMFAVSIPIAFKTEWAFVIWVAAAPVARLVSQLRERG